MTTTTVLHFLWQAGSGGAERAVTQLALEQLRDPDLVPAVALGCAGGRYQRTLEHAGVPVIDLGMSSGRDVVAALSHLDALRRYSLHHFHSPEPAMFLASLMSGRRVRVYTRRGGTTYRGSGSSRPLRNWFTGVALRHFWSGYSGNTRHAASMLASAYGVPAHRVHVTYNGVDFGGFRPRRTRGEVRLELGVSEQARLIGCSGKLWDLKRNEILVRAAGILREADVHVLLVGDGPERARLRALAHEVGVGDRLIITGMTDDVASYVQAMDVFVLASDSSESFANALVEAMSLGIPSVACSDSPGPCEHIDDGFSGFIADDLRDLVRTLERLLGDDALRAVVGESGALAVKEKYGLAEAAARYRELYRTAQSCAPGVIGGSAAETRAC